MSESEPRLIRGYLQVLAAQLPASIVDELADGLAETHRSYLGRGLSGSLSAWPCSPASDRWRWRRWAGGTGFPFSPG